MFEKRAPPSQAPANPMRKRLPLLLAAVLVIGAGAYYYLRAQPATLVLTGLVTTNDVIVSAQVAGQISQLLVKEGDVVRRDRSSP